MTFPTSWTSRRVRFAFTIRDVRGVDAPLASATKDGVLLRSDLDFSVWNPDSDVSNYKLVEPDDFVIGLRSFQHGISHSTVSGIVSPAYTVLRANAELDPRFYKYYFRSSLLISQLANITQGIRQGQAIDVQAFRDLDIPVPCPREQRRIADFLHAETAHIDALESVHRRLKALMSERLQRIIDIAIEQHQNLIPLRYVVRFREGPGIMAEDFQLKGVPLIRVAGLQDGNVTLNGCNFLDPEKVARRWRQFGLQRGDRLLSGSATMGEVSVVNDSDVVGAIPYTGLIILRPAQEAVDMKYVEAFLRSSLFARQIDGLKTGAALQHFGPTHLSQIRAPLPLWQEQKKIVAQVGKALDEERKARTLVDQQLTLLAERRQALITAAVTGQIDVSTANGRGIED